MPLATAYENTVLDYILGKGAPTSISGVYLDLYNQDPTTTGVSVLSTLTGSSTRPAITASMASASGGIIVNESAISITSQAAAGAFVFYAVLFDAATGGNMISYQPLTNPQTVTFLNGCSFPPGALSFQLV